MNELSVRRTSAADRVVLERLWLLFRHDMSEFEGRLPNPDGSFRSERLESALSDPDWCGYLFYRDDRPAGFAFVRSLSGPARVLNSFFVVRGARRSGVGLQAVKAVVAEHPGPWEVAFQDANARAVAFWRRVATEVTGSDWSEERRQVPGDPSSPPDVWITFDTTLS
jgi:predicted acetyltransferase